MVSQSSRASVNWRRHDPRAAARDFKTTFADKLGVARPQARLMMNTPDAVVLVVHAAALLAVLDHASTSSESRRVYSAGDVLTGLLGHEARYGTRAPGPADSSLTPAWNAWLSPSPA